MHRYRRLFSIYQAVVFIALLSASSHAQVSTTTPESESGDQTLVLTPFEVTASKDVGFVATSALAGGRLAGDLKDTPAAYSVLTREFLDALGIIDLTEASQWVVNTTDARTDGSDEIFGEVTQINSRGVRASDPQRNFFALTANYDSYNVDRVDFSRGPNAILFGSGTFGGTATIFTKTARTDREFGELRLGYGSWDNRRATLDYNRPLNDKLALRLNALWADRNGWRNFEMERKKAATLAGLWKATQNTEVRFESEFGHIEKNNPITALYDGISGWDGLTTFGLPGAPLPADSVQRGVSQRSPTSAYFVLAPGLGMTTVGNFAGIGLTLAGGTNNGQTPVGGLPVTGGDPALDFTNIMGALNVTPHRFDRAVSGSSFEIPGDSFAVSTNHPTMIQDYRSHSLSLRQKVGENLYFEVAGNLSAEHRETQYMNYRGLTAVYIDINQNLPGGAINPHFLDAYSDAQRARAFFRTETKNLRLAAAYQLNNTRLGSYTFNTYGGMTKDDRSTRIMTLRVLRNADPRNRPFLDTVFYRYYLNEYDRPVPDITTASFANPATGATETFPADWLIDGRRATDANNITNKQEYLVGAIKAAWWKNKLHLLGAIRYDHNNIHRQLNKNYGDYPADWDMKAIYYRPDAPADYLDLMYIPKDAAGNSTGPAKLADRRPRGANRVPLAQYANDRFRDDYNAPDTDEGSVTYSLGGVMHVKHGVSLFANYSTGFSPSNGNLFVDGTFLPSAESHGYDFGFRVHTEDNRYALSVGRYSSWESPQSLENQVNGPINNIADANPIGDFSTEGRNIRGFNNVPLQTFDIRDRSNVGYEIELTANPTPNWRLSLNVALADAYQENAYANSRTFFADNDALWRQILADTGVLVGADDHAIVDTSIPVDQRSPDANRVANAWNSIQNFKASLATDRQRINRLNRFVGNFFTDYRFSEGWLKGFGAGFGLNYRGRHAIGYLGGNTIVDPNDPTKAIDDPSVGPYDSLYIGSYKIATGTLSYRLKLSERRELLFNLRIMNLFNNKTPLYYGIIHRPPNGDLSTPARVATPDGYAATTPRSVMFTTTIKF